MAICLAQQSQRVASARFTTVRRCAAAPRACRPHRFTHARRISDRNDARRRLADADGKPPRSDRLLGVISLRGQMSAISSSPPNQEHETEY